MKVRGALQGEFSWNGWNYGYKFFRKRGGVAHIYNKFYKFDNMYNGEEITSEEYHAAAKEWEYVFRD